MKPSELLKVLAKAIPARLSVLIKGAPGVGKTEVESLAASLVKHRNFIFHPAVSDPTDYKGLPGIVDGRAEFLPYGDLRVLLEAREPTVAFLDDLGQAPAAVQAAVMQLILARRVNSQAVSDHVVFLAATNRREDRAGVTGILEPVKSRFAAILQLDPDLDDWCRWAFDHDMPAELIAFLRFRPGLLLDANPPTSDIVNRPCPRNWAWAGKWLNAKVDNVEVLAGAVGEGAAAELAGFLRVCRDLPSVDGILLDPDGSAVPREPGALYAVSTALAARATADNGGRVVRYARRLPQEFGVLTIRDAYRRCPVVSKCADFVRWSVENKDALL
jgi:hypothetical protein